MPSEIRRKLKNTIKNYTDAQVKVREATSNEPWGPSSTVMGEIADLTYNVVAFSEIMQMIWKRLNDHGKNWRHVYKSLTLLEYIIKTGSERVAQQCKENIFAIQTLKDFQHVEDNKDQGVNVREKAKTLVSLLKDDERLKNERAKALKAKERFAQNSAGIGSQSAQVQFGKGAGSPHTSTKTDAPLPDRQPVPGSASADSRLSEMDAARPATTGEEELQLQLALAMSKEQHEEEMRKERTDDVRLQLAVQESIKEEEEQPPTSLVDLLDPSASVPAPKPESADPWGLPAPPPTTHTHHHTQPPTQAPRSDPWGSPTPAPAPVIAEIPPAADNDPWGNTPAPVEPSPDPWGAPPPTQAIATVPSAVNDPWSGSSTPANPSDSPWGTPSKNESTNSVEAAESGFDMFAPSTNGGGNNGNIDNEFDLLSSRTVTQTTASPTNTTGGMLDMTGMQMLSLSEEDRRKKTPKDFLGANSNLVNLDNLVTKPATSNMPQPGGSSTNPFDMSSMGAPSIDTNPLGSGLGDRMPTGYNPFVNLAPQPTPLSQIQANPMSMNFQQTNSGMFPTPMAPVGGNYNQPVMGHPMHSNNPFL